MRGVITILASFCAGALALAQNPVIPMTAVTGKPDRAAVTEMLEAYREVGIEQFLIYPRSGLEIEYMSDEWMAFCRNCLEVADSLDMKVWLYDEYNWPSGNCKGQVAADGHEDCYPSLLLFDKGKDGRYTTRVMHNPIGADILNPEAVSRFVQFTHERYYSEFKEYFGRVIPAIFTDEPSFSYSTNANKGMLEAYAESQTVLDEGYVDHDGKPQKTGCWRCQDEHIGDQPFWSTCYIAHQLMVYYRYLPTYTKEAWGEAAPKGDRAHPPRDGVEVEVEI